MTLPEALNATLERMTNALPRGMLSKAASDLTGRYRCDERDSIDVFMSTDTHRLAYLAFRMPATYAVVKSVLGQLRLQMPEFAPVSLNDLGAGPGTASWAAVDVFPSLERIALLEKDPNWQALGKRLMEEAGGQTLKRAVWRTEDIARDFAFDAADLTVLSYVIGELSQNTLEALVDRVWNSTGKVVAFIEPGTPHGFERIRAVRSRLIALGACLVAPCPHQNACPMKGGNWCHFTERLERSALHRQVKDVEMGYEDEKYSYIIASKTPVALPEARILRHPGRHSGHIDFEVCAREGLEKLTLSKRNKELYKAARKLDWGDTLPPDKFLNQFMFYTSCDKNVIAGTICGLEVVKQLASTKSLFRAT